MPEWPTELLAGLDAPRQLSSELRFRLEQALSAQATEGDSSARALDDAVSARLEGVLADPLAAALAEADHPRPLRPPARRRIERALGVTRRSWVPGAAVAAGVMMLAGVGLGLGLSATSAGPPPSGKAAQPASRPTPTATAGSPSAATTPSAGTGSASAEPPESLPQPASGLSNMAASPSAPEVDGVEPASGPASGGTWVTITGSGLSGATAVAFSNTPAQFDVVSSSQLRVMVPAHAPGTVDVRVSTASTTSVPSTADHYTYR